MTTRIFAYSGDGTRMLLTCRKRSGTEISAPAGLLRAASLAHPETTAERSLVTQRRRRPSNTNAAMWRLRLTGGRWSPAWDTVRRKNEQIRDRAGTARTALD